MARIYKGSKYNLQLLIGKSYNSQYRDVKISFYTSNSSNQVIVTKGIYIDGNIATVEIGSTMLDKLEDGLIKYIASGKRDGIAFIEERQSNYFLRSNNHQDEEGKCPEFKLQEKVFNYKRDTLSGVVYPDEGYDGLLKVTLNFENTTSNGYYRAFDDYVSVQMQINGEACAAYMEDYSNRNNNALGGFFNEHGEYNNDYIIVPASLRNCEDISNMGYGDKIIYFTMYAENVKKCENAFNGWTRLAVCQLDNLGNSFEEPQTLDISDTSLHYPDTKYLAESLYDFSKGPNKNGVETSYIKGVYDGDREYFTNRGWQVID
jgi:hypothetical protein